MKKPMTMARSMKFFREAAENLRAENLKTVWMTDLKKAGERAEYYWSLNKKKGTYGSG